MLSLAQNLGWFDFEAATRLAGSNFALYKSDAVKLVIFSGIVYA